LKLYHLYQQCKSRAIIFDELKKTLPFLFIFGISFILYYPVFFTYFSQDDFFHFKVSLKFTNFLNMFGFYPFSERGIAFYRPIFREVLFNLFYSVFGLNQFPFRILQFFLLFLNSILGFFLVKSISKNSKVAYFTAFFYATCSSQVSPLYYLAGGIQVLGATTFLLLTVILTFKFLEFKNIKYLICSYFTFLLALFSHELSSVLPFLIIFLILTYLPYKKALDKSWQFIPFFIILAVYLYLEVTKIGFSSSEKQYQTVLSIKGILNAYMWYGGWALGLPEMLIDFVKPGFKLNPDLMRYWGNYYSFIFPAFFLSISLLFLKIALIIYQAIVKNHSYNKKILFFIFWFMLSLIPVVLLPLHKSTQYLEPGLVPFWAIIGFIIFGSPLIKSNLKIEKVYIGVLIGSLFLLSSTSIVLERTTYPASQRGQIAEKLIKQITLTYPTLPKGSTLYIQNDPNYPFVATEWGSSSKQAALILNNADALQLIYKDPSLKVYYQDFLTNPKVLDGIKIYSMTAKIF